MAEFKLPPALAASILVILISAFYAGAAADPNTATLNGTDLPPAEPLERNPDEAFPGLYELSRRCIPKLTDECGREVVGGLFNKENKVSQRCCGKLVAMGRECHIGLMKALLLLPDLTENDRSEIAAVDKTMWSECLKVGAWVRI